MMSLRRCRRIERKVAPLVKSYDEGRRLMRHGDGADEWVGAKIVREALLALVALGRDEHGHERSRADLVTLLRRHGLHAEADRLAES